MGACELLQSRKVTRLCHFTKVSSLTHILLNESGILASSSVNDKEFINDSERYDGNSDYVCCSIQYPNWWYYNKVEKQNQNSVFKNWVVLYIDLSILKNRKCKFCPCNAAKKRGYYIFENENKILDLYDSPNVLNHKRTTSMLSCCPTDDQAEIQIQNNVPLRYIRGIAVGNDEIARQVYSILKTYNLSIPIIKSLDIFLTSSSNLIRRGIFPSEERVNY